MKNTGRLRRDLPLLLLLGLLFGDFSSSKGEFLEVFLFLSGPCVCVCVRARARRRRRGGSDRSQVLPRVRVSARERECEGRRGG